MSALAIDVRHLRKMFADKIAVDDVDIHMPKGQVWGFLGPNGSGKTTTIRMICGLLKPDGGEGECLGLDIIRDSRQIKYQTGYMTQHFSFWRDLSIRENLEFVGRMYQLKPLKQVVDHTLEKLGLQDRQKQLAGGLSGGWKQRLALAAVTMHQPKLLLLDEPTAGVDPQARRDFWDEIHRLSNDGMTVLVSTHYMDEAERCDQIVYLANGRLITQGTVADIVRQSGLHTYRTNHLRAREWVDTLRACPDIEHVAFFGAALHVSGKNPQKIKAALGCLKTADSIDWQAVETSLEDTFIALMKQHKKDHRHVR